MRKLAFVILVLSLIFTGVMGTGVYTVNAFGDIRIIRDDAAQLTEPHQQIYSWDIQIFLDGRVLIFDSPPVIVNDRTMVPFRAIFEAFDAEISWNSETQTVTTAHSLASVILTIGDTTAFVSGTAKQLDVPPIITNDRTMVPLRFISEAMGATVDWNSDERIVDIWRDNRDGFMIPAASVQEEQDFSWGIGFAKPSRAPWDTPAFRNDNQQNNSTNFALINAMRNFRIKEQRSFPNMDFSNPFRPLVSANEIRLSDSFGSAFIEGFQNDSLSQIFPFNAVYLESVFNSIDFALYATGSGGILTTIPGTNRRLVAIAGIPAMEDDNFVFTAIHEVGHAIGLGESLTNLFTELFLDTSPARPGTALYIHEGSYMNYWWERNSYFDRPFLDAVGVQEFWQAAFTSNEAYLALINRVLDKTPAANFTAEDLMLARRVVYEIQTEAARHIQEFGYRESRLFNLYNPWGESNITIQMLDGIPRRFYRAFNISTSQTTRSSELILISEIINSLADFGRENNIKPTDAVLDWIINLDWQADNNI
ncbi:MAG: stalk domain-containing protein [Defluviitaleaceae bacterium]|nr:stalk domain-containing protein [Defluviitaleaceae bacterium]